MNDHFVWKSNVLINNNRAQIDLVQILKQGRYLIETRTPPVSYIYLWVLNDKAFFKHFKYEFSKDISVRLELQSFRGQTKKIMFKYGCFSKEEAQKLHNDFNIANINVSEENLRQIVDSLCDSSNQLCESLKYANDFYFAIV